MAALSGDGARQRSRSGSMDVSYWGDKAKCNMHNQVPAARKTDGHHQWREAGCSGVALINISFLEILYFILKIKPSN